MRTSRRIGFLIGFLSALVGCMFVSMFFITHYYNQDLVHTKNTAVECDPESDGNSRHNQIQVNQTSHAKTDLALPSTDIPSSQRSRLRRLPLDECEIHTGFPLLDRWESAKQVWCGDKNSEAELICYPLQQPHGIPRNNRIDTFCRARNFVIDFSKISNGPSVPRDSYLTFADAATTADCVKTAFFDEGKLMNHQRLQLRHPKFMDGTPTLDEDVEVIEDTHYLFARDEDATNPYHATTDFFPAFIAGEVLDLNWQQTHVVIWDSNPKAAFEEQIQRAFSPNFPLKRLDSFSRSRVKFREIIFHLEAPASPFYAWFTRGVTHCRDSLLWEAFRLFMLDAYGLRNVPQPRIPQVTLLIRSPRNNRRVPRRFKDLDAVVSLLKGDSPFGMQFNLVDPDKMSLTDQMAVYRNTTVLVGIHGAGLVNVLYLADEAVLLEIHPGRRVDYYFRVLARMLPGKHYLPMRTARSCNQQITEETDIDHEDLRSAADGALRIARQFNGGSAECGLICSPHTLITDPFYDGQYGLPNRYGHPTKSKQDYVRESISSDSVGC